MGKSVKFIHAADIHLGTPIRGLRDVAPEWATALQSAVATSWGRVVNAAIAHEVDFVILAGDMFDSSRPSYGDYLRFFEGLEQLDAAGIPTYLVTGNHDPYTAWERDVARLPRSATMLGVEGPQFTLFARAGEPLCLIGGRSYYNQAWPEGESISGGISRTAAIDALASVEPRVADAPFFIGVVHTALVPDQSKAQVSLQELLSADVDYWACGHLHERLALPDENNPRVVFPGCVQGRDINETGERGCYLVELSERDGDGAGSVRAHLEFIPTSSMVLQQLVIDVSACQTLADVRRLVQTELFHENGKTHCDEMITRITLVGKTSLNEFLAKREIIDDMRQQINNSYPTFFCDALVNQTRFVDDARADADGDLFPEIVAALAEEQRARQDVLINFVQSEFVKRGVSVPGSLSARIGDFNDAAEMIVLGLLREGLE